MSLAIDALLLERVDGVRLLGPLSLQLAPGECVGLVGESGSGKSLVVQALFGVLPPGVRQAGGSVWAFGTPMDRPGRDRDHIRGARMAWVPQDPRQALNPLLTLAQHLTLLPGVHHGESASAAQKRLAPLLERLGLPMGGDFLHRFPHQISGGQRQRISLAMALSCNPELLVLDEPTTALDPLAQKAFLDLVLELQRERDLGYLWITHDLGLASRACERLLVLYGGEAVEAGSTARLLSAPRHPYTARLLTAARRQPSAESGFLLAPQDRPDGCPFRPRCPAPGEACGHWGPWRGDTREGLRCERPLEPAPQP
ncbi:MAG TPA: ABC transporter ATP-binding protein [Geothrix sp.]|jgi:oligopeptide/dipeptide ABC transporter ATP-binding protein